MADGGGMSGLSFSEIGAGAKKAGQKVVSPFLQSAKSQFGMPAKSGGQSNPVKGFGVGPGDIAADVKAQATGIVSGQQTDTDIKIQQRQTQIVKGDSSSSGVFDIAGFEKSLKNQTVGGGSQSLGQPKIQSSKPPNESPVQPKAFDPNSFLNDFNENDPFGTKQNKSLAQSQVQQPSKTDIANQESLAKQQAEDKQKYASLLNKLHEMQVEDVLKAGEGGDKKKQEEEQKKKEEQEEEERKQQEKEEKMQEQVAPQGKKQHGFMGYKKVKKAMGDMLGAIVKRKQGSHEGSGGKG